MAKPFVKPDKEQMRLRFWELKKAVDTGKEKIAPLRAKRDEFVNKFNDREQDAKLMEPIRAIQADVLDGISMYDAENEMAMIARYLGGVVGEPPEEEE